MIMQLSIVFVIFLLKRRNVFSSVLQKEIGFIKPNRGSELTFLKFSKPKVYFSSNKLIQELEKKFDRDRGKIQKKSYLLVQTPLILHLVSIFPS